jgi:predicted XRE-type DNA-binding protein
MQRKDKITRDVSASIEEARSYLADQVAARIESLDMTQRDIAEILGVKRQQVNAFLKHHDEAGFNMLLSWSSKLGIKTTLIMESPGRKTETFELAAAQTGSKPQRPTKIQTIAGPNPSKSDKRRQAGKHLTLIHGSHAFPSMKKAS